MQAIETESRGTARHSMRCPVCHCTLTSNTRIEPREDNKKGFSAYDFAGTLFGHFARGCR